MNRTVPENSKTNPISLRLQPELNEQLTAIATAFDRPKSWIIEQAIRDYLLVQSWQLAAIEEGIEAADAGRVIAHGDVAAWVASWDKPDELPIPE